MYVLTLFITISPMALILMNIAGNVARIADFYLNIVWELTTLTSGLFIDSLTLSCFNKHAILPLVVFVWQYIW